MFKRCVLVFIVIILFFAACEKEVKGVVGVWQIEKIHSVQGLITDKPVPSIFIFTPGYYSMLWVLTTKSQQPFAERWNPTDEEKIKRFDSMIINSGTYEIDGSTLTMYPVVARIPDLVGGKQICEYSIDKDTLRLKFVDEYSFDGVQAPWVVSGGLILTLVHID